VAIFCAVPERVRVSKYFTHIALNDVKPDFYENRIVIPNKFTKLVLPLE
jgi:hypothetical protein